MSFSPGIELVWQMAAREAIVAEFKEILPEHFLAALLKLAEMSAADLKPETEKMETGQNLAAENEALRAAISELSFSGKEVRHRLRTRLGKGDCPHAGGRVPRAPGSRDAFSLANELAQQTRAERPHLVHLWRALLSCPTPLMKEVLGLDQKAPVAQPPDEAKSNANWGDDIIQMATTGALVATQSRLAESKVMAQALEEAKPNGIWLVTENPRAATEVLTNAACLFVAKKPRQHQLRLIDLSQQPIRDQAALLVRLQEAAVRKETLVWLPAIEAATSPSPPVEWIRALRTVYGGKTGRFVCAVAPSSYLQWILPEAGWKQTSRAIWIHESVPDAIPETL